MMKHFLKPFSCYPVLRVSFNWILAFHVFSLHMRTMIPQSSRKAWSLLWKSYKFFFLLSSSGSSLFSSASLLFCLLDFWHSNIAFTLISENRAKCYQTIKPILYIQCSTTVKEVLEMSQQKAPVSLLFT